MATMMRGQLELCRCPHCSVATPMLVQLWSTQTQDFRGARLRNWGVYSCSTCGGLILCACDSKGFVNEQYPTTERINDPAIPERARNYLGQASDSLHAPVGAVILAASSVDAMLKAKRYKEGSLNSRIDQAVKDHLITEEMGKWAHQVRLDANEQRHADETALLPTQDDARRVIEFAKALALFLFSLPALVDRGIRDAMPKPEVARPALAPKPGK